MRALLFILVLLLTATTAIIPAKAEAPGSLPAFQALDQGVAAPELVPASFLSEIQSMPTQRLAAIIVGGFVGGIVADSLIGGGLLTVLGVLAGASLGSEWYAQGWWPLR